MSLKKVAVFEDLSVEVAEGLIEKEADIIARGFSFKPGKVIHDILEMEEAYLQGKECPSHVCRNDMADQFEIWLNEILDYSEEDLS